VSGAMTPYVVRQGDYLAKLAFVRGFDADEVWNDPKNQALRDLRKNPNILHPGDVLYLPAATQQWLPLQKGTTNQYTAKVPRVTVRLGFKNEEGPMANEPYVVEGLVPRQEGSTDGGGMLTLRVPLHVREVSVVLTKHDVEYPVRIGDMDPIDEASGLRKRLQHLGYRVDDSERSEDEAMEADGRAIATFQRAQGMVPTGDLDDATKAALVDAHGS